MMKKLVLLAAIMVSTLSMNAQEFNLGLSGAIPTGDASNQSSFGINADVNYLWEMSEQFDLGLTAGYHHYFGEDYEVVVNGNTLAIEGEDVGFLPVALAGRFNASESFTIGADLGYGIGVSPDGNDGGFYYAPKVQYGITESLDLVLSYKSVNLEGDSWDTITLGIEFGL